MAEEILQQVDENDVPIGGVTRKESKTTGKRYRIVRIIVEDPNGDTLIQKRVATKDTYPNCWDNSAAGHVDLDESYESAAERELFEEIGLKDVPLSEVQYYYLETVAPNGATMNRFTKIYKTVVPRNTQFQCQESEVSEVRWATIDEVRALVEAGSAVSDGLQQTYERYYKS